MASKKYLGIWMDHSNADLIDFQSNKNNHSISSEFTFSMKEEALNRSESLMHNKEQQKHETYFRKIGEEIRKYDDVLIFGPTNAKRELHNFLNKDLHFKDINFEIESSDKMSDNEKDAFVRNHLYAFKRKSSVRRVLFTVDFHQQVV